MSNTPHTLAEEFPEQIDAIYKLKAEDRHFARPSRGIRRGQRSGPSRRNERGTGRTPRRGGSAQAPPDDQGRHC